MRPKQGPGAAGARPLSRHTTRVPLPSGVRWPGVFLGGGQNFPRGFPIYTPLSLFCPGHLIDFSPCAPYFLPPGFPYINFPPIFSLFTPIFSIYIKFSPG
jgi:hypothetical protein